MGIIARLLSQAKRPHGRFGRVIARFMNVEHSRLTDWALAHVSVERDCIALDIGCGGGRTVHKLATAAPAGKAYGIDISEESLAVARRRNRRLLKAGSAEVLLSSVESLPFAEGRFDLVISVESYYFWPDFTQSLRQIYRVLKPAGRLVIVAEAYRGSDQARRYARVFETVTKQLNASHFGGEDFTLAFSAVGFLDSEVFLEKRKGWICAIGRK